MQATDHPINQKIETSNPLKKKAGTDLLQYGVRKNVIADIFLSNSLGCFARKVFATHNHFP